MAARRGVSLKNVRTARRYFADVHQACIDGAVSGSFYVNDLDKYVAEQEEAKRRSLSGEFDGIFSFRQRAWWLQTGECNGLLGNGD